MFGETLNQNLPELVSKLASPGEGDSKGDGNGAGNLSWARTKENDPFRLKAFMFLTTLRLRLRHATRIVSS